LNSNHKYDVENSKLEFKIKVELSKPKSWLKTVSAFANLNGGLIVFGIDNSGSIIGIENPKKDVESITELINSRIEPIPRYELHIVTKGGKNIVELRVGDGPRTPYYYLGDGRKETFIRSGSSTILAPKHILDNLILKGTNQTYDELPTKYKITDLSFTLLNANLIKENSKGLEEEKDYISLGLMTEDGYATNAGLLLCDKGPLKQSKVVCTKWKGLVKGSINGDAIDDKEYYNSSIITLLDNSINFVKNHSLKSWDVIGLKRVEREDYPLNAVREALVNAYVHRDYQILGAEIHVDMFDDRLEITSPGGMLDGSLIQNLDITKISAMRRNRIITDIFNRLHLMDVRGSGLIRIIESYTDHDIKPIFTSTTSSFKVILPNKRYQEYMETNNHEIQTSQHLKDYNTISDEDYFILKIYKVLNHKVKQKTIDNLITLYKKFTYDIDFNREDVEEVFEIKKSRAAEIIKILLDYDLITSDKKSKYKFKK